MSPFKAPPSKGWTISPLRVETLSENQYGRMRYRLLEPLVVSSGWNGAAIGGLSIEIPAGFVTDFASVSRFFWRWFPPSGNHAPAAVVHDWFYRNTGGISRFLADALFRDIMAACGTPFWQRWCMWAAVRLRSWKYWK